MVKPDVIMYNTIIDGLCKDGCVIEAHDLFCEMVVRGISLSLRFLQHG